MTFQREVMAALCLTVVWVNTLLICARALEDFRRLRTVRRRLMPARPGQVGMLVGSPLRDHDAEPGPRYRLVQTARTRGDGKIHFHDRVSESVIEGGRLLVSTEGADGERSRVISLEPAPRERSWVWPDARDVKGKLECPSVESFDQLAQSALGSRGAGRTLELNLMEGERVHVVGLLSEDGARVQAPPDSALLVSAMDPRKWLDRQAFLAAAVTGGILLTAGMLTALSVWPPAFGTLSKIGAFGLLLYFLLVQPLGVWLSEKVQFPHEAAFRGTWNRGKVLSRSKVAHSSSGASAPEIPTNDSLTT